MAARRILALAVALLLVGAALLVRDALDDGDGDRGGEAGGTATSAPATPLRLRCATELAAACQALAASHPGVVVSVAPGLTTADELVATGAGAPAFDAWLTLDPLPAIVGGARTRAGRSAVLGPAAGPLARSPLVLVAWSDRRAALEATCRSTLGWSCLGDHAGQVWAGLGGQASWGVVKPGHTSPGTSASGLLVLAQALVAHAGTADLGVDALGGATGSWLQGLERAVPRVAAPGATPLAQALSAGPSTFDVVATTEAEAAPALARSARGADMAILYPAPMASADVVIAPVAGAPGATALVGLLGRPEAAAALAAEGWRVAGDPRGALPDGTGLPEAGLLEALRSTWSELVR